MHPTPKKPNKKNRGLTLMEAVIAIGVVAFAVPIILAATSNTSRTRRHAEADTRSIWIATELQRQLTESWRGVRQAPFDPAPNFPDFAPLVYHFDNDGKFLQTGNSNEIQSGTKLSRSVYLVTIQGVAKTPQNFASTASTDLSLVTLQVQFPAQAPRGKRHVSTYDVLIPRQKQP